MAVFFTLASGSSGNCAYVEAGGTRLLVDMGISLRSVNNGLKTIGLKASDLDGILITHAHSDHVSGLKTALKQLDIPVFSTEETALALGYEDLRIFEAGADFELGAFGVRSFSTPHDCAGSVGFVLETSGLKIGIATDLGHMPERVMTALTGVDFLMLEANHDVETLKMGSYPYFLKRRVLSDHGHLSNELAAQTARVLAGHGTRQFLLAHLSRENNTPEMAMNAVSRALEETGAEAEVAPAGLGVYRELAERSMRAWHSA